MLCISVAIAIGTSVFDASYACLACRALTVAVLVQRHGQTTIQILGYCVLCFYEALRMSESRHVAVLLVQPARGTFADQYIDTERQRRYRLGHWKLPRRTLSYLQKAHNVSAGRLADAHCVPFSVHAVVRLPLFAVLQRPGMLRSVIDRHVREYMLLERQLGLAEVLWSRVYSMAMLDAPAKLPGDRLFYGFVL